MAQFHAPLRGQIAQSHRSIAAPVVASVTSYLTVEPVQTLATNGAVAHGGANGTVMAAAPTERSDG